MKIENVFENHPQIIGRLNKDFQSKDKKFHREEGTKLIYGSKDCAFIETYIKALLTEMVFQTAPMSRNKGISKAGLLLSRFKDEVKWGEDGKIKALWKKLISEKLNADISCYLGKVYFGKKQYGKAEGFFSEAGCGGNSEACKMMTYIHFHGLLGNGPCYQLELNWYEDALKINPHDIDALNGCGSIFQTGREYLGHNYNTAKQYFKKVIDIDKNNVIALNGLGVIAFEESDFKSALEYFERVYALDPLKPDLLFGKLLLQNKDFKRAQAYLKALAAPNPSILMCGIRLITSICKRMSSRNLRIMTSKHISILKILFSMTPKR